MGEKGHVQLDHDDLSAPIERIAAELAGDGAFSAPVIIPPKEELGVRLVNVNQLIRLDEAQGDVSLFQNAFWLVAGGILGLFTSAASNMTNLKQMDRVTVIEFGSLLILLLVVGTVWRRYHRRASAIKAKILGPPADHEP